jgi:hypothetical protein
MSVSNANESSRIMAILVVPPGAMEAPSTRPLGCVEPVTRRQPRSATSPIAHRSPMSTPRCRRRSHHRVQAAARPVTMAG